MSFRTDTGAFSVTQQGASPIYAGLIFSPAPSGISSYFTFPTASVGGNFSTSELMLVAGTAQQNTLVIHNTNALSFPAITFRGDDKLEHLAIGYTNSGASFGGVGQQGDYIEISSFPVSGTSPPPIFYIARTGYVNGSLQSGVVSAKIENNTGVDGRWNWFALSGASSIVTMQMDPLNNFVTVNHQLLLGIENTARTPVATFDNYGKSVLGANTSSRSADATAILTLNESASNQLRMIRTGSVKVDFNINTGPLRLDLVDTDHSSVVPLSVFLDGTKAVTVGGPLTIGAATMITTTTAFTNGAAAAAGTLLNAPTAGNPTKWIPVVDNGTTRYIPAW